MSSVIDYLRWYQESDVDGDTMDTAELAVAYAKHCLSEELREVFAIQNIHLCFTASHTVSKIQPCPSVAAFCCFMLFHIVPCRAIQKRV